MPAQSARQNATNSELDAKKIVTHSGLTSAQRDELISQYSEIVVDSMDMDSLVQYAQEQLANYFDKLSDSELKEDIKNYDDNDGLYEELVDNITNNDPIVYNTNINGGKS